MTDEKELNAAYEKGWRDAVDLVRSALASEPPAKTKFRKSSLGDYKFVELPELMTWKISTHCPSKWAIVDLETGQVWDSQSMLMTDDRLRLLAVAAGRALTLSGISV